MFDSIEIKLERVPAENVAEITATLDRVRIAAKKLVGQIADAADQLSQGMKIVLTAAAAKQKLNSNKS